MRPSSERAGSVTRRVLRADRAASDLADPSVPDLELPALSAAFAAALRAFASRYRSLLTVYAIAAIPDIIAHAVPSELSRLERAVWPIVAVTATLYAADAAMQDTSAGVGAAFRRAIARLLPQAGATLIVAVAFILLLFVAAFCGGGALLKEAQHLSSPALGSTVSIQQTLLWIVIIMLAGLVALPITTVTAFAALGIALENDGPWTALINAVAILSAPSTRRYFIWFAIVSGFAYPVIAIQLNLATMIASALYLPMASTLLAAIFYTPATIIIALFSVRVWRVADARRAVAAASAAAAPSWVSLALAYLSLCVFTYGAVHPHYGFVWTTMTIPTAARPFPPQGHERYQSYATCARENFPTGRVLIGVSQVLCVPMNGFSVGW